MSIIKETFCTKLISEFDKRMKMIKSFQQVLDKKIKALTFSINSVLEWSLPAEIQLLDQKININLDIMVPQLPQEFDEIMELINKCLFAKSDPQLSNPSTFLKQMSNDLKGNAFQVLTSIAVTNNGAVIPEFNVAKLVDELKKQIETLKINTMIPEMIQLLECINAICGTNIHSRISSMQSFLNRYGLNEAGELEVNKLLMSQGIDSDSSEKISLVVHQISEVMVKIDASMNQGLNRLKNINPF